MGHIKKRSPGSWTLFYELARGPDGKRKQKTVTVRGTKKDAERRLKEIEYEVQIGTHVEPSHLTLETYLNQWLNHAEAVVSAKTHQEYRSIVENHVIQSLGGIRLSTITPLDVQAYYQELLKSGRLDGKGGLSAQTIRHHHTLLHKALSQAVGWRLLANNPVDAVTPPRVERRELKVLDEAQTSLLLSYARGTRLYIPILIAVTTGLRRGEVLALRWTDVDYEVATLSVQRSLQQVKSGLSVKEPKSGRGRVVQLPQITVSALRRHKVEQTEKRLQLGPGYHDQGLVCPRQDGTPWPPSNLSKLFCEFVQQHEDLPRICFHGLRHSFATLSLSRGIHAKTISAALGHASITVTMDTYGHVLPVMATQAAAIFDAILDTNC